MAGFRASLAAALSLSFASFISAQCLPQPVVPPVTDVSVHGGKVSRGVPVQVGSPPQNISFAPYGYWDNIYVHVQLDGDTSPPCNGRRAVYCATIHGGWYDNTSSTTGTGSLGPSSAGAALVADYPIAQDADWTDERVTLAPNLSLSTLPLGRPDAGIFNDIDRPQAILGLGPNSTLLHSLQAQGLIGSPVWSYFYGLTGPVAYPNSQLDGSLIMGGYDAGKISGPPFVFDAQDLGASNNNCPFKVSVSSLSLVKSGQRQQVVNSTFPACIDPAFPGVIQLDQPKWDAFHTSAGLICGDLSTGIDADNASCDQNNEPNVTCTGNLEIQIQGAHGQTTFTVRVDNKQLISNETSLAADGTLELTGRNILRVSHLNQSTSDPLKLGRKFLSSAYLLSNTENKTFTLWASNPSEVSNVVAIDKAGNLATSICAPNTTAASNAGAPANSESASSIQSLSGGAIAGIVIGATAVLAITAVISCYWLRKSRLASKSNISINFDAAQVQRSRYLDGMSELQYAEPGPRELETREHVWAQELAASEPAKAAHTQTTHELDAGPLRLNT